MNRLIQGDVGSGKTVIACISIIITLQRSAQSAFLAPTSILAEQHFRNLTQLLANPNEENPILRSEEIALLIGDTPEKEKVIIRKRLASGEIKVVIGTHALIEDPIKFKWLQLVIIDEQHRFGVGQRAVLRSKGVNPHLLVMSATPIPRSLALTIYGDLDLSVIDEMPVGRIPIETHVMLPNERERAYQLIQSQIEKTHQAFIIYPLIESEDDEIRKAAINEYERIRSQVFPHLKIGLMHGRLKQSEKDDIMKKFRDKEFDILISTSVIEVGLDIPNATIVLIESANHFGLSQLHQIRGRVGRGQAQSYCLLIPDIENNFENERLSIMAETNDGFKLAEYDLKHRGPGDFLGTRQSGYLGLKLASLTDLDLILRARKAAQKIFKNDPELLSQENIKLRQELETYWPSKSGDVS
jgi:ATP-dependent DNA helicase RecG